MEVDEESEIKTSKKKHRELFNPNVNVFFDDYGDEDDYGNEEEEDEDEVYQENVFNQQNAFGINVFNGKTVSTTFGA